MKTMLPKSPNDPDIPRNASDASCVKEDRMEGEREREIELGEEDYGRDTRTHEQRGKRTQIVTNFIKINICVFCLQVSIL